jgi:ubiquitin carboxyl-terminal hydrolase 10
MASAFPPSSKTGSAKAVGSVEVREEEEPPQEDGWMEVGRRNRMVVTRTVSIFIQGSPVTRLTSLY